MIRTLLLLTLWAGLHANLENHLKPIEGKSAISRFGNIDYVYLINVDPSFESYMECLEQLIEYEVYPHRFVAVNPDKLSERILEDIGVPSAHDLPRSSVAMTLSHLSVLQDAYDAGYKTIWVIEEGIHVLGDLQQLPNLIQALDQEVGKEGWDILFTDLEPLPEDNFTSQLFRKVATCYGTYSMIINRSGMEKILAFFKKQGISLPYDLGLVLVPDMHLYTLKQGLISNHQ
ncbi:MAG: hypothetical protein JSS61_03745 [Verrucomicrobia bacterium]|nr:hypothetical protein [Verrucomicrobiota bacterium]